MTIACTSLCVVAQQVAVSELPDAPTPVVESSSSSMSSLPETPTFKLAEAKKKHRWLTAYNESVATLALGEVVDAWSTHRNLTHPKFLCGYNPVLADNSVNVISTTDTTNYTVDELCGTHDGLPGNYAYDVTQLGVFTEVGWAAKWGLAGNRDFARIETENIASDVLHAVVVKYLCKKGGWKCKVGNATLLFHAEEHLRAGVSNFRFVAKYGDPNAVYSKYFYLLPNWAHATPQWWGSK